MKTRNVVLILTVVLLIFQSCLPSLHPLYTADTIVVNDEILGAWFDGDSDFENVKFTVDGKPMLIDSTRIAQHGISSVLKFEKGDKNAYQLTHYDDQGLTAKFDIYLVKIGDSYYMDFYPITEYKEGGNVFSFDYVKFNSFEALHYYPVHTFAKVTFEEGALNIAFFDPDYIGSLIEKNRVRIKYEDTGHGVIFTASTEELQEFVLKYGEDEKLFLESTPMVKPI